MRFTENIIARKGILVVLVALIFVLFAPSVSLAVESTDSQSDILGIFNSVSGFLAGLFKNAISITGMSVGDVSGEDIRIQATAYYVNATSGNDSWSGTLSEPNGELTDGPWKTIQHAADTAQAGDHVMVKAGAYNEFVTIQNSGEEGNPIIFEGERGPNEEWLTIIDPSTPVSGGWIPAPEIGEGVYKQDLGYQPFEMTVDGKSIPRITNDNMDTIGPGFLALPHDAEYNNTPPMNLIWGTIGWWDGLECMYGYKQDNGTDYTYIRFRNGDDPNSKTIRASPNDNVPISPKKPGIKILSKDYITIRDFAVRGAYWGIAISEGSHCIIEDNYVTNGFVGIGIELNESTNNTLRNNELFWNYYGYDNPGSWEYGDPGDSVYGIKEGIYKRHKFLFRDLPNRIRLGSMGPYNKIYGNEIHHGTMGISLYGSPTSLTHYTEIYNNTVYKMSGNGMLLAQGTTETEVYDNMVYDCNANLRWHRFHFDAETSRTFYIYRNRLWHPEGTGKQIHIHWNSDSDFNPTYWFYHNSLSGGKYGLYNARANADEFLPNVHLINNVFSTECAFYSQISSFYDNATAIGLFDNNWIFEDACVRSDKAFFGVDNILTSDYLWDLNDVPDFLLVGSNDENMPGTDALDAGIDVSEDFKGYSALPGMESGYYSGLAPDIGAYEYAHHKADTNNDNSIDMPELMAFIARWKANATDVSKAEVEDARGIWFGGGWYD